MYVLDAERSLTTSPHINNDKLSSVKISEVEVKNILIKVKREKAVGAGQHQSPSTSPVCQCASATTRHTVQSLPLD